MSKVKGWAPVVIALAGVSAAAFSLWESRFEARYRLDALKRGAKEEIAATDLAHLRLAERVARIEGERSTQDRLCVCVPRTVDAGAVFPGFPTDMIEEPESPPEPIEEPEELFRKPARSDPTVQRKIQEYNW